MKRALITGAGGFAGSHLSLCLLKKGYHLIAIDRSGSSILKIKELYNFYKSVGDPFIQNLDVDLESRIHSIEKDLNHLEKADLEPFECKNLDSVFHLAGMAFVPDGWKDPAGILKQNSYNTVKLAQIVTDLGFSGSFVFASSGDVYGPGSKSPDVMMRETDALQIITPYSASKRSAELFLMSMPESNRKFNPVIARPFNHIGPAQSLQFVVPSFLVRIAKAKINKESQISVGDLQSGRDFTDVRDVAEAYCTLAEKAESGEYNICSSNCIRIGELLRMAMEIQEVELEFEIDQSLLRPDGPGYRIGSYEKLANLGWMPEVPLRKTLSDTLAYLRFSGKT